jgi:RimJ/RimL family protein N-acetyltransferase/methionyl-tRNA formyltransferase
VLTDNILDDGIVNLRCLRKEDVNKKYFNWLHDPDINRFLEIRHTPPNDVEELVNYIDSLNLSLDNILFGIFIQGGNHIGNIKLGPINFANKRAEVGLLLGDKSQWGKGYATRAIRLVSKYGFKDLNLNRLTAGCYESNKGSFHAFIKAGYKSEGQLSEYWQFNGKFEDEIIMGITNSHNQTESRKVNFGQIKAIVFIGGGNNLLMSILLAQKKGFVVGSILALRHANEITSSGQTLLSELQRAGIPVCVANTVMDVDPIMLGEAFKSSQALCFGSAWIFPDLVRARFGHGMLNFNGIPIPHYLGGAHHTWQILNFNRSAGCHIQEISDNLDRGDILFSMNFQLSDYTTTPDDYFSEIERYSLDFLENFFDKLINQQNFLALPFENVNDQRLYFPRLITAENGWIDWSWSGPQIAAFCSAFGSPYRGASTRLNGRRIYIKRVKLIVESSHPDFHPFCSGLIVRRLDDSFFIAVSGGLLKVDAYEFENEGNETVARIREGDRMFTDAVTLDRAIVFRPQISVDGNLISNS